MAGWPRGLPARGMSRAGEFPVSLARKRLSSRGGSSAHVDGVHGQRLRRRLGLAPAEAMEGETALNCAGGNELSGGWLGPQAAPSP